MPEFTMKAGGVLIALHADRADGPFEALTSDLRRLIVPPPHASADITIALHIRNWNEPSPLKLPADAALLRMGGRKVFSDKKRFFIDYHENAFFVLEDLHAEGVCYLTPGLDPLFWTEMTVNQVILLMLRRKGIHFLHAGGALAPSGKAMLFTGYGGSGKSSAALSLAARGCPLLGDDILLFDSDFAFHPYPKTPSASDWTVETLRIGCSVIGTRMNGKKLLDAPFSESPATTIEIFHPVPATNGDNAVLPIDPAFARELISSQTKFCSTDELISGPLPNLDPLVEKCREIRIGNLPELASALLE